MNETWLGNVLSLMHASLAVRNFLWYRILSIVFSLHSVVRKTIFSSTTKDVLVIFGSQTGTAEEYAERFSEVLRKAGKVNTLLDAFSVKPSTMHKNLQIIFIVSTHGVGEPPDNIAHLFTFFRNCKQKRKRFTNLSYAIFGIGDSSYVDYNSAAKDLSSLLESLGAHEFHPLTLADTAYKLDLSFQRWMSGILNAHFSVLNTDNCSELRKCAKKTFTAHDKVFRLQAENSNPTRYAVRLVKIASTTNVSPGSSREVKLLRFASEKAHFSYEPGDHLGCYPPNEDAHISTIIRLLAISDDEAQACVSSYVDITGTPVSPDCTVISYLRWHVDLHCYPKTEFIQQLMKSVHEGSKAFIYLTKFMDRAYASQNEYRTVVDIIREAFINREDISLEHLLNALPMSSPRLYSISNYAGVDPQLSIAVSIVEGGLCSQWLCLLREGDSIPVFLSRSSFHLGFAEMEKNVVFIGTGTGIAPFIGFLQKKHFWLNGRVKANLKMTKIQQKRDEREGASSSLGTLSLYFGCRTAKDCPFGNLLRCAQECTSSSKDFKSLYLRDAELPHGPPIDGHSESLVLNSVFMAYSREGRRFYVQNRLAENGNSVWHGIRAGGIIFICGDAIKMCQDVERCLARDIVEKYGGYTREDAIAYIEHMKESGQLRRDVWDA